MKGFLWILVAGVLISSCNLSQNSDQPLKKGLKIMIQVDFEGVTGVVNFDEIYPGHPHFERNTIILTKEINAAVEG
ncbi:MAG: M55 family metallopeptidase, partial [Bacteroidales bacterium]|nr:M55 family metallopeptidase [Bacteroidales bacterium]